MSTLNLSNVINISVSTPPAGLADFQVNNLIIFTNETPLVTIPNWTCQLYRSPSAVATDWGSGSEVYSQAVAIFSQTPNILNGGGQLIIAPIVSGQSISQMIVGMLPIQFFGGVLVAGVTPTDSDWITAAATAESLRVKLFIPQFLTAALTPSTGLFAIISASAEPHARMLLYTQAGTALGTRRMAAAYAGRAMSVDFTGSSTTNSMHLKQLATVLADTGITQTTLNTCITLGVDVYCSIAGRPSVFSTGGTTGGNAFFDEVYNLDWLVLALQTAGFNALASTSTKLPQTEPGIAVLRGAYINVLNQAVTNGYVAPGAWNSPELFGNPADLIRNILEAGFYVYNTPVNLQSQSAREARQAPVIQLAIKLAGAVHSSAVVVYVNP